MEKIFLPNSAVIEARPPYTKGRQSLISITKLLFDVKSSSLATKSK